MTIADLEARLGYASLVAYTDAELAGAYTSDLLSDVIAHAPENSVLITLQAHKNTVACASLAGVLALVLTGKAEVPADLLDAARQENLAVFRTADNQFTASWKIAGLLGLGLGPIPGSKENL
ncbi:MAG: DRTGG domain-containing protein [Spirochaetales bacterium]